MAQETEEEEDEVHEERATDEPEAETMPRLSFSPIDVAVPETPGRQAQEDEEDVEDERSILLILQDDEEDREDDEDEHHPAYPPAG